MSQFEVGDRVQVQNNAPDEYAKWRGQAGTIVGVNVVRSSFSFRKIGEGFDTPEAAHGEVHLVQFDEGQDTQSMSIDERWLYKIDS
jgi:hypothetical protein